MSYYEPMVSRTVIDTGDRKYAVYLVVTAYEAEQPHNFGVNNVFTIHGAQIECGIIIVVKCKNI